MPTAMKAMLSASLGLTVCLVSVNCTAQADQPAARAAAPTDPGLALIEQVARAYKDAPAMADDYRITMRTRGQERVDAGAVRLGPGADAWVSMEGYEMTALDGTFTVEHVDRPEKYFQRTLDGNLLQSFAAMTGGNGLPVPHAVMRYGTNTNDYLDAFGLARTRDLRIIDTGTTERDGRTYERVTMANDMGFDVTALIDADTKLIAQIDLASPTAEITMDMAPTRLKRLDESLSVKTEGRRRVDSMQNLMNLSAGDDAPDITLPTLAGAEVSLADHRGSLVVLDFWATWCGPCKMGLPKMQEFATWAKTQGHPVAVLPVDMGERQRTVEAKREVVSRYWKNAGFTMQTLMDYDNTAARAFQVGSIPHTVVVDPKGKIVKVEVGFNRNVVEELKELTRRTFGG